MRPNGFSQAACYTFAQNSADSTTSIAVLICGKLYLPFAHPQSLTRFRHISYPVDSLEPMEVTAFEVGSNLAKITFLGLLVNLEYRRAVKDNSRFPP